MILEQFGFDLGMILRQRSFCIQVVAQIQNNLEKVTDVLDVWFDSGSTWYAVLKSQDYDAGNFPADLYLEGQ